MLALRNYSCTNLLACHRQPLALLRPHVCCGACKSSRFPSQHVLHLSQQQSSKSGSRILTCTAYKHNGARPDEFASQTSHLEVTTIKLIKEATSLQQLEQVLMDWSSSIGCIPTAAAFVKAAKLSGGRAVPPRSLMTRLANVWADVLHDAGPREISNVLWACGKLKYTAGAHLWRSTLTAFLKQHREDVVCFDVANAMYGLALVAIANRGAVPGVERDQVEAALCQLSSWVRVFVTHPTLEGVGPQDISNVLLAYAKLRYNPGDVVLKSVVQAMGREQVLEKAAAQSIANTLYALSELYMHLGWQPNERLLNRVWGKLVDTRQLQHCATRGTPQEVSNILLAVARLSTIVGLDRSRMCARLLLHGDVAQQLKRWNAQDVSNSMWACAKLGLLEEAFFNNAVASASSWLPNCEARNVKQIAYACGALGYKQPQLAAELVSFGEKYAQQSKAARRDMSMMSMIGWAVALTNAGHLAQRAYSLVATSDVKHAQDKLHRADADRLWQFHCWLVRHQLLDGTGLAGVLTEQQLAYCEQHHEKKPDAL